MKRLFCTGEGAGFRFTMAETKLEAEKMLNASARTPDPDDLRYLWMSEKLYEKTPDEIKAQFGITRQALSLWRTKAGVDLPRRSDHMASKKRDAVRDLLRSGKTAQEIAQEVHTTPDLVRQVAANEQVELPQKHRKKPDDAEIARLAQGRTWRQLAEECNVTVHTLQHYVYARPELAAQVRAGLVYEKTGAGAHGRVDVDKLVERHRQGLSAYRIASELGVQTMTVLYWLKKLGLHVAA